MVGVGLLQYYSLSLVVVVAANGIYYGFSMLRQTTIMTKKTHTRTL